MLEVETEKYLSCLICRGIVEDPVTLNCNHTYCRQCMADYIKSRGDARRKKIIPCALKCEDTKVPDPEKPSEDWANQLKPSFIVSNLMDDFRKAESNLCSRCSRNNTRSQAVKWCRMCGESLCQDCISLHRRDPVTHPHKVTDLPQRSRAEKPSQPYPIRDNLTLELTKLEYKIEEVSTSIATNKSKVDSLVFNHTSQQKLIRDIFQKIKEEIQERETLLLRDLDDAMGKEMSKLQDVIQLEEPRLEQYQQRVHFIYKAVKSGSLFDMHRMCEALLTAEMAESVKTKQPMLNNVKYHVNGELLKQLEGLDFGIIEVWSDSKPRLAGFKSSGIIECRLSDDKDMPSVHDITVLEVEGIHTIVITDYSNNCLKSFFTSNIALHSRLPLKNQPKGLTKLNENVLVAVPDSREIVVVAVTAELKRRSVIQTREGYISLAVMGETSLVAGRDDCVDILNMTGEVMKSFSTHNNAALFSSPSHMCVSNSGQLLVSDWVKKRVTCLTREGHVAWTYTGTDERHLRSPEGITATSTGDILVADSDMKKVIQLSKSGEYIGDVFISEDDLGYTEGICMDKHGSLFVSNWYVVKRYSSVQE